MGTITVLHLTACDRVRRALLAGLCSVSVRRNMAFADS
jgi:hypothetical protein